MSEVAPQPVPAPSGKSCDRADALVVLARLREAGHVAYFAGGCVRDLLLGREPKDFDVATDAPPNRVRQLFPSTQAVGAAFGVILVRHRRSQIEVATFRADGQYLDGRRPEAVRFTSAEEDARRRDFTINGLFLDPLDGDRVIDHVGGQADLAARQIRAIGDPGQRFGEDYLRLLRAVRFAARLGFAIEPATADAIKAHAPMLTRISPERSAEELRAMLPPPTRVSAWRLLVELGLAEVLFRFLDRPAGGPVAGGATSPPRPADALFALVLPGEAIPFPLAMAAATVQWLASTDTPGADARRWFAKSAVAKLVKALRTALRLSNDECEAIEGTLAGVGLLVGDAPPALAARKRFLARPTSGASRHLLAAMAEWDRRWLAEAGGTGSADNPVSVGQFGLDPSRVAALLADLAALSETEFAPPPLITGDDLTAAGLPPGPKFKRALDAAYDAQLEGRTTTREEAMRLAGEFWADGQGG